MKKIVMKFGGSSVAGARHLRCAANLIADYANRGYRIAVVISALRGITDELIEASEAARNDNRNHTNRFVQKTVDRHLTIVSKAIKNKDIQNEVAQILRVTISELERVLTGVSYLGELTPKSKDHILSFGERLSATILWGILRDIGLKAQYYTGEKVGIVTDSNFGEASPLMNVTKHQVRERLDPLFEKQTIPVVTGYIATTQDGETTTLGRGGSDYTATIIGAALEAEEVWIWKDVDGLMTSDPKIISSAQMIPELSFQEAIEMAIFGAKAIHPRALEPAMEGNIPVRIRNAFNPESVGTLIVGEQRIKPGDIVKVVTLIRDVALVNISGTGMVGTPGTAAKVFDLLGRSNINILMISQSASEANISFIIQRKLLEKALSTLELTHLGRGIIREVSAEDNVCVIAAVGAGMKGSPGVAARVFGAIARRGINIRMIAQGSSELNISFVVKESDGEEALRAIHEEFSLDKKRP